MRNFLKIIGVFLVATFGQSVPAFAVGEDVFVVPRVPVQAEAANATAAKAIAQTQGRRRAMDILLRRLTVEEDWIYLPRLTAREAPAASGADTFFGATDDLAKTPILLADADLEALESSFEVYSEKSSATTYRAFITYRFKPEAVRRLLKNARLPYSETQTRTALVLPVLQTDSAIYLWESNNPWMAAWKSRPFNHELTPMTAPLGDLEDASTISARQALALDADRLRTLAERYSVSQVIIAHARLRQEDGQDKINVRLINGYREADAHSAAVDFDPTLAAPDGAAFDGAAQQDDYAAKIGDVLAQAYFTEVTGNFPALAEQAIETTIAKYAKGWKTRTLIDHTAEAILEVSAFFRAIEDWTKIRAGLVATPLVGSVQVYALSPQGAEMRLKVFGDPQRLAVAMENYGVTFWTENGDHWFLAAPRLASQLRGSRHLKRYKASFDGVDDGAGEYSVQPAVERAGPDSKIEQRY